jgi:hypothetical protein
MVLPCTRRDNPLEEPLLDTAHSDRLRALEEQKPSLMHARLRGGGDFSSSSTRVVFAERCMFFEISQYCDYATLASLMCALQYDSSRNVLPYNVFIARLNTDAYLGDEPVNIMPQLVKLHPQDYSNPYKLFHASPLSNAMKVGLLRESILEAIVTIEAKSCSRKLGNPFVSVVMSVLLLVIIGITFARLDHLFRACAYPKDDSASPGILETLVTTFLAMSAWLMCTWGLVNNKVHHESIGRNKASIDDLKQSLFSNDHNMAKHELDILCRRTISSDGCYYSGGINQFRMAIDRAIKNIFLLAEPQFIKQFGRELIAPRGKLCSTCLTQAWGLWKEEHHKGDALLERADFVETVDRYFRP